MSTLAAPSKQGVFLPLKVAAEILNVSIRTLQRHCERQLYATVIVHANGGDQQRIDLQSLPPEAQHRYWARQIQSRPVADRRAHLQLLNLDEQAEREVARLANVTRKPRPLQPLPLTPEERQAAQIAFDELPDSLAEEARRRTQIMLYLSELDPSLPVTQRHCMAAEAAGESPRTIRRWGQRIRHLNFCDWSAALAPAWDGGRQEAEISEGAWNFIYTKWASESKPALGAIYRSARSMAEREGWALPSYKTVLRRINALPATTKAYLREGNEALGRFFPDIKRDYSTLRLHQMWCSDGRKADVFCVWPDGYTGRPIVVGWQEIRTRKILGWSIGKVENAELVRLSFREAARRSNAIPDEAYIDNGRAYASKQITGGQPTRNRFKANEGDPHGVLTLFDIKPVWATPHHGQAKPIESFWKNVAEGERRQAAFKGCYCSNRPGDKPEEFNPGKFVPIAHYAAFVREAIETKNSELHRGDSMEGYSPDSLYAELSQTTVVRQPSAKQMRLCLTAAETVMLDKSHRLTILGNCYWSERLAKLAHRGPYTARYNPEDASEPVALFDGSRFICEAPIWSRTGFRDMAAAKDHQRQKSNFKRAERERIRATAAMNRADQSWDADEPPAVLDPAPKVGVPSPKIARIVRLKQPLTVDRGDLQTNEEIECELREFRAQRNKGMDQLAEQRKRAAGGE